MLGFLGVLGFALGVVANVLHFVKSQTSNKTVAKVSDDVDKVVEVEQTLAPVVAPLLGDKPVAPGTVTDHRK